MDPFCFSADRLATSKPSAPASAQLHGLSTTLAHTHLCRMPFSRNCSRTLISHLLSVTAASHQPFLQHGSEESASTDSDQNGCDLYIVSFSCLRYI